MDNLLVPLKEAGSEDSPRVLSNNVQIHVEDAQLADLRHRLETTRWPNSVADEPDWSWGTPPGALRDLVQRWMGGYDWRSTEDRLNSYAQSMTEIAGINIHCFHAGPPDATPLMLLHGWPDSPLRFEKALPYLAEHFHVVVPSIPGYGFSDQPLTSGYGPTKIAHLLVELMASHGFSRFGIHGADIGSAIAEAVAVNHPDRVIGLHLGDVPFWRRYTVEGLELSPGETEYMDAMNHWAGTEGAYAALHKTKPQTLAYSLNNSPVGLAAWMLEKFRAWSDCNGDVWSVFSADEIIDNLMIYWLTQTSASSVRYYREASLNGLDRRATVSVPTGFTIFPRDIPPAPREFAERFFNVASWNVMPRGGHFGPWEEPNLFSDEIVRFFGPSVA